MLRVSNAGATRVYLFAPKGFGVVSLLPPRVGALAHFRGGPGAYSAMVIATTVGELRAARRAAGLAAADPEVGFVPTMGYLHEGHATLLRRARAECGVTIASIFVNPTQFGPGEDFATYPRDLEGDLATMRRERVDIVLVPGETGFYPPGADTFVEPGTVAAPLEGAARPGHFRGVATVVTMLFNAVRPHRAYFGEKDWQQLQVVRRLVRDLHLPVAIMSVPTVREADGLALSSRNVRLSPEERAQALCVPRALEAARAAFARGENDPRALERAMAAVLATEPAARPDYAVVVDAETLQPVPLATAESRVMLAVRVGPVRLIDNGALGG